MRSWSWSSRCSIRQRQVFSFSPSSCCISGGSPSQDALAHATKGLGAWNLPYFSHIFYVKFRPNPNKQGILRYSQRREALFASFLGDFPAALKLRPINRYDTLICGGEKAICVSYAPNPPEPNKDSLKTGGVSRRRCGIVPWNAILPLP